MSSLHHHHHHQMQQQQHHKNHMLLSCKRRMNECDNVVVQENKNNNAAWLEWSMSMRSKKRPRLRSLLDSYIDPITVGHMSVSNESWYAVKQEQVVEEEENQRTTIHCTPACSCPAREEEVGLIHNNKRRFYVVNTTPILRTGSRDAMLYSKTKMSFLGGRDDVVVESSTTFRHQYHNANQSFWNTKQSQKQSQQQR